MSDRLNMLTKRVLVAAAAIGLLSTSALGQCFGSRTNLTPLNVPDDAQFGEVLSMKGDLAVIAAPLENFSGAVYIFRFINGAWVFEARLTVPIVSQFDRFGDAVDTDGERVIISSPFSDNFRGQAFIYTQSPPGSGNWVLEDNLQHPENVEFGSFGSSVAIEGDTAVVGDRTYESNGVSGAGAAFVFTRSGSSWIPSDRLDPNPPNQNGDFGETVAMTDTWIAVGGSFSGNAPGGAPNNGLINVYQRTPSGVVFEASLAPPDLAKDFFLGDSLDIDGDRIISGGGSAGSRVDVFIFRFDPVLGWSHEFTIPQITPLVYTEFGGTVAISGDLAVVGESELTLPGANFAGAARLYRRTGNTWNLVDSFFDPNPAAFDAFGIDVAIDAGRLLIGSEDDDAVAENGGAAFSYVSAALSLLTPLQSQSVALGDPAAFPLNVVGAQPLIFEWFIDGQPLLSNVPPYAGFNAPTLSIAHAFASLPGGIRARVTDFCGTVLNVPAVSLTVTPPVTSCKGDSNGDGVVNFSDITSVLVSFNSVCP